MVPRAIDTVNDSYRYSRNSRREEYRYVFLRVPIVSRAIGAIETLSDGTDSAENLKSAETIESHHYYRYFRNLLPTAMTDSTDNFGDTCYNSQYYYCGAVFAPKLSPEAISEVFLKG